MYIYYTLSSFVLFTLKSQLVCRYTATYDIQWSLFIIYIYIYIYIHTHTHTHTIQVSISTLWRIWLRHCATSRKVAGLISDGVSGIFNWLNSSARIMALGSTQPLTEMSTRHRSSSTVPGVSHGVKGCRVSRNRGALGGSVQACKGIAFYLLFGLIWVQWFAKHTLLQHYSYWPFK